MRNLFLHSVAGLAIVGVAALTAPIPQADAAPQIKQITTPWGNATTLAPETGFERFAKFEDDRSFHADIAFYETVLSYAPVDDPRVVFLLANAYIVTNQQKHGLDFYETQLATYEVEMRAETRAVYLSAYALLRATYAERVGLLSRIGWVNDTFEILKEADKITDGQNPLVHWASGLIYTQVPGFFGKREEAKEHLEWLIDRPELEPTPGFYREAYRHLATLSRHKGDKEMARTYLNLSGYSETAPETLFMGWFATSAEEGLRFTPRPMIEEVEPGRVFAVQGFGFSELHFIVSANGEELISIDAGTQPYSLKAGIQYLRNQLPELPPLTTVFVTHSHWDHVGGHSYFRLLDPKIKFYGRANFGGTLERADRNHVYNQFRGEGFKADWITTYAPDVPISDPMTVTVGGSTFELVPATGGETEDALLIFDQEFNLAFAGDVLMPFYGEPWVEEGYVREAVATIDSILSRGPRRILHGHYGLTGIYGEPQQLSTYRRTFKWLIDEVDAYLVNGYSAEDIRRLNLIPPSLYAHPEGFFGYVASRDHVIARLSDHMTGIWRENIDGDDPRGLDTLTLTEYGRMMDVYFDMSESKIERGLKRMIRGGDNELALKMASAALRRHPDNTDIRDLRNEAADRLRSATQYFDPFRFVTYTELSGQYQPELPTEAME
ncbi:MAG: MBL fold metallo-hydrolase [Henriciella sp.]|jgi:glyoxylase-like metal-dependent hydrolase (beta-lactamase superfamily II)